MKDNFEVYTSIDKAKRDVLFEELRKNGTAEEKQAVKISGNEPDPDKPGKYRSTWSVAHPREGEKPAIIRRRDGELLSNLKEESL